MQAIFLILFTLFWSGMVLFMDSMMARDVYNQYASGQYPFVTGKITHSEVQASRGSKGGTTYSAKINYAYQVGSQPLAGDKLRFNLISSAGSKDAYSIVAAHPVGSDVAVYYNPAHPEEAVLSPGLAGGDLMLALFATPFNVAMLGFWAWFYGWLRERLFRPVAGGVKIIEDKMYVRIRLPQSAAFWWGLGTAGGLAFLSVFIVGLSTQMHPSMPVILSTMVIVYGAALAAYARQWRKINSGIADLVINEASRTMELPLTQGRKEKVTLQIAAVESIWVEKITHVSSKGSTSYTYAPTLRLPKQENSVQRLADWSDKLKAEDFATWLSQKLGVPKQ